MKVSVIGSTGHCKRVPHLLYAGVEFVQANESFSRAVTVRGLHFPSGTLTWVSS